VNRRDYAALAQQIRTFRGRLSRRDLCEALGLGKDNLKALAVVSRVCRQFSLVTADDTVKAVARTRIAAEITKADQMAEMLVKARQQLAAEIYLARKEAATAPAYKPADFEW
jgi:hypothetical protein